MAIHRNAKDCRPAVAALDRHWLQRLNHVQDPSLVSASVHAEIVAVWLCLRRVSCPLVAD